MARGPASGAQLITIRLICGRTGFQLFEMYLYYDRRLWVNTDATMPNALRAACRGPAAVLGRSATATTGFRAVAVLAGSLLIWAHIVLYSCPSRSTRI